RVPPPPTPQDTPPPRAAGACPAPPPPPHPPPRRIAFEHGSGPRLSIPMLVLHHHQRAGPQEPFPLARRRREDHPRQLCPGHPPLLHHRRQLRPQPRLGAAVRPSDRAAR